MLLSNIIAYFNLTSEERRVYRELDEYTSKKFLSLSHSARETFMNRRKAIQAEQERMEAEQLAEKYYSPKPDLEDEAVDYEADEISTKSDSDIGWHMRKTSNGCFHAYNNAPATYYRMKQLEEKTILLSDIIKHINNGGNLSIKYGQDKTYRIEKTDDIMCELLRLLTDEFHRANSAFFGYRPVPYPEREQNKHSPYPNRPSPENNKSGEGAKNE